MKPEAFGAYTLLDILGRGGMGEVYLAKPRGLQRLVALKRIHGDAVKKRDKLRFTDEANIAARLNHANIAQVYDHGSVDGELYLAMEFIQGHGARQLFDDHRKRDRAIPASVACHVVMKSCEALEYAHNRRDFCGRPLDLVHRDVGLGNLMLSFDGEVKLIDFGIAQASCRYAQTDMNMVKGTPAYMAPEQLRCQPLDRRSDVFSCGVVLFELLTGQRLFSANTMRELIFNVCNGVTPSLSALNPRIPPELDRIAHRALARRPDDRYQSAGDFHDDLLDVVRSHDLQLPPSRLADWMRTRYRREHLAQSAHIARLWASLGDATGQVDISSSSGIPRHIVPISSRSVTRPNIARAARDDVQVLRPQGLRSETSGHGVPVNTATTVVLAR